MVKLALIGAGNRGMFSYAPYALDHKNEVSFVAVAEPDEEKRNKFARDHKIPQDMQFASWQELLDQPKLCEALVIATQDRMHYEPTMQALDKGYDILLEKPMSPNPYETLEMTKKSEELNRNITVCHVLRYSTFFSTLKEIVDQKKIGEIMTIQWSENVGIDHFVHSFVRGNWSQSKTSSPMLLQKSCHDMDVLQWLIDSTCKRVSSFGHLTYFKKENAPAGCSNRCTDCEADDNCLFSAINAYYNEKETWPQNVVSLKNDLDSRLKALKEGSYGRCAFHCDNDVVDHQVVNLEFENQVTVTFTMSAFTKDTSRTFKIMGTKGEITGSTLTNEIEVQLFSGRRETITPEVVTGGHGGADTMIMRDFIRQVKSLGSKGNLTSAQESVKSHLIVYAAEESRKTGMTVNMKVFKQKLLNEISSNNKKLYS